MAFKFVVLCATAVLIQSVCGQYTGNSVVGNTISIGSGNIGLSNGISYGSSSGSSGLGLLSSGSGNSGIGLISSGTIGSSSSSFGGLSSGFSSGASSLSALKGGSSGLTVASGGPLTVTSISPIGPSGLAVASENAIEGVLTVTGQLPFLSAVAFEGGLPTSGSGVATCGCGSGDVGITSEGLPQGRGLRY